MNVGAALRIFRSAALAAGLALTLTGCESFDLTNLIPDSKKKLPGERREVFPGGTPGVPQGVPPELVKGYQAPPETAEAQPEPEQKQAAKPKPKARPKPTPSVAPEVQQQQSGQAPAQAQQGQWPSQQSKPAQQSAWPASPAPGTFSR